MRTGVRTRSGPVTVVRLESTSGGVRCGIVTGRHLGNAVLRNRIKRRIREAAKRASLESASDYVIVPNHRAASARFAELVTAIEIGARSQKRET